MLLSKLATLTDSKLEGEDREISCLNSLKEAKDGEVTYIHNIKLEKLLKNTKASAVFITKDKLSLLPKTSSALICENPHLAFALASKYFFNNQTSTKPPIIDESSFIHPRAYVGNGVKIGKNVTVMANATIGDLCIVEDESIVHSGAVLYPNTKVGKRCHILANAVIGSDGFGYAHTKDGKHIKIYHLGDVILEDDVEIGACTTVDRGVFGSTIIKKGSKIDNLVQIGHNCELGENTILVSQVGLSGSTKLGRNVVMGGQSATSGHLEIGDFATIAARGGVSKSIKGGETYGGFPLTTQKKWLKLQVKISRFFNK